MVALMGHVPSFHHTGIVYGNEADRWRYVLYRHRALFYPPKCAIDIHVFRWSDYCGVLCAIDGEEGGVGGWVDLSYPVLLHVQTVLAQVGLYQNNARALAPNQNRLDASLPKYPSAHDSYVTFPLHQSTRYRLVYHASVF